MDCSGADSGKDACWPQWVRVGAPVIVCVLYVAVLALMILLPSKTPREDGEGGRSNGDEEAGKRRFEMASILHKGVGQLC